MSGLSQTFYIRENDRLPVIAATMLDADSVAVPLGAASSVVFQMRLPGATSAKVNSTASITSTGSGTVEYVWAVGDTNTPGKYICSWQVTFSGKTETFPNSNNQDYVIITPEVA